MATATLLQDYLGRWLTNVTPGTSAASDFLGRSVLAGNHDFLGRNLAYAAPTAWVTGHAYSVGDTVSLPGGAIVQATAAGTSAATAPTAPPAPGGTVNDGAALKWVRLH